jgi:hypothetical protein
MAKAVAKLLLVSAVLFTLATVHRETKFMESIPHNRVP